MTYSPEESQTITEAVMMSGMAVAIADMGIVSTAMEMTALAKEIVGASKKFPSNSIIQEVFSEEALKHNKMGEVPKDLTQANAVDKAIAAINAATTVLEGKATPEEIAEFKQFIYDGAETVANAAGSGLFGSGKTKVSDQEAVALSQLKTALAL